MRLWWLLVLVACSGALHSDPLPMVRPVAPYLCARSTGGDGDIIIYTSESSVRLLRVGMATQCRTLPTAQEVYIGFEPTVGLHRQRIFWTPIPLRPQAENVGCYFVDVDMVEQAIGMIRPCIEWAP